MDPRPLFSKRVLSKVKTMKDGRSVDVISGKFSCYFLPLECYLFH